MKLIVTAVDFSAVSMNAAEYAVDFAGAVQADVTLLHVCHLPLSFSEVPVAVYRKDELTEKAERTIAEFAEKLRKRVGSRVFIHTEVRQGDVMTEIEDYCAGLKPYAVVMGPESTGVFDRFLFGSKTLAAARRLSWPLIIVPANATLKSLRKVGLACDFRDVAETVPAAEIEELVKALHADLHVVHVSTADGQIFNDGMIEESGWLQNMLAGLHPAYDFIYDTDIERSLAEFAETNKLDLLIIIPKRHNVVSRLLCQSHSRRIILHSHIPLMTLHE